MGWVVFRFWDFEIRKECERCVAVVEAALVAAVSEATSMTLSAPRKRKPAVRTDKRALARV